MENFAEQSLFRLILNEQNSRKKKFDKDLNIARTRDIPIRTSRVGPERAFHRTSKVFDILD